MVLCILYGLSVALERACVVYMYYRSGLSLRHYCAVQLLVIYALRGPSGENCSVRWESLLRSFKG